MSDGTPRGLVAIAARLAKRDQLAARGAVPGMFPAGLTVAFGSSGTRKSFYLLGAALRVAGGLPVGPLDVRPGLVVYIAAEDRKGIEERALAGAAALGVPHDAPIRIIDPPRPLGHDAFVADLEKIIAALAAECGREPSLIVLDTLAAALDGVGLNDDGPIGAALANLLQVATDLSCSVVVAHHTGKSDEKTERGSRVIRDRADAAIRIEILRDGTFLAEVVKARNGVAGGKFRLAFDHAAIEVSPGDMIETLCLRDVEAVEGQQPTQAPKLSRDARLALGALQALGDGPQDINTTWRNAAYSAFGDRKPDAKRRAFLDARNALMNSGFLVIEGSSVSVRKREDLSNSHATSATWNREGEREDWPVYKTGPHAPHGPREPQTSRGGA